MVFFRINLSPRYTLALYFVVIVVVGLHGLQNGAKRRNTDAERVLGAIDGGAAQAHCHAHEGRGVERQ